MKIELPDTIEDPLRDIAERQGRDVGTVVVEAIQQYLDATSITDLHTDEVAETQTALLGELTDITDWGPSGA